jgi:hypothetical protein
MTLYTVNVTVGSSEQEVAVVLDTGSSDTWFNIPSSSFCQNMANDCERYGIYDNSSSRTYTFLNHEFNITYNDGTKATGDYVKDTIQFGGVMLSQFQFGIAEESTSNRTLLHTCPNIHALTVVQEEHWVLHFLQLKLLALSIPTFLKPWCKLVTSSQPHTVFGWRM